MFKKLQLSVIVALMMCATAFSQANNLQGVVRDATTGEPLAAVTVSVKGETRGTTTNEFGIYSINVSSGDVLVFSFVGFVTQEIVFEGQSTLDVDLQSDVQLLEDVVVVAYGSQKRKAITGAVSTINKEFIEARPITTFQTALQGTAPGVSVSNTTGQPGAGASIQIRGAGSLTASTQPLYVVDGVPVVNLDASGVAVQNVLNTLNPSDIESISLLKDASASALYGSRAANGVVLITTKRGQRGPARVNVRVQRGFNDLAVETHETLGAEQYYRTFYQEYYADNVAAGQSAADAATNANNSTITLITGRSPVPVNPFNNNQPMSGANGALNAGTSLLYDTDWMDETISSGVNTEYDVNVSGGNDRTQYYLSANIFEQEGLIPLSDFSRGSFRMNIDTDVNDWLNVSFQTNNVITEQNNQGTGGSASNPFRFANLTSNVYPFFERDANNQVVVDPVTGEPQYNFNSNVVLDFHPVGIPELDRRLNENMRSTNNLNFLANVTDDISVASNLSLDIINSKDNFFWNRQHGDAEPVGGRSQQAYNRYVTLNVSNQVRFNKVIDDHSVDFLVGQEYFSRHDEFMTAQRTGFATDILTEVSAGTVITAATSSFSDRRILSLLSRMNYGFREKYFVTASLRRDGASEFGTEQKWGTFGSIGASWIISQESFLREVDFIDNLKFRASWGTTGNNSIGAYAALGLLDFGSGFDYNGEPGSTYTQLANPDLKWEVITTTDIGMEYEILDNRLSGELVYYERTSADLLFGQPIPVSSAGFSEITTNLAEMRNWGMEASLNYRVVNNKDLIWSVYGNLTTVNNEITELPVEFVQEGTKRFEEGRDRYSYFIQEWAGVDPENGAPLWYQDVVDAEGNPTGERTTTSTYADADRYYVGSSLQDLFGGFGTSVNYKGFDVNVLFSYGLGGQVYDFTRAELTHLGENPGTQLSTEVLDAWTPENTDTDVPRFGINNSDNFNSTSSRFLYNGDFLRLRNLTLGYSLDRELLSKINVRNLRVFVVGENLLTFSALEGLDPEVPRSGNTNNIFPAARTITFGFNIGF
ncbi:MAG: TonB-dependent receptor [Bacteroidota bacterium]